ncbi:MAG: 1-deoxy-D-xylulose-5-phosphate synthase [Paludibacteraceae bacterium]|nr:1-deoxy-D-xylulose-5-phosphate synthase [Paludibacteraceae bacterium]
MKYKYLHTIQYPSDLKALPRQVLPDVCEELRAFIVEELSHNPGHLGSSLGTVELTVALHYVFDTPHDQLVWDVGHQAYAHKILTGRRERFHTNRQFKGLSPFTNPAESEYDAFVAGHASNSISAALGIEIGSEIAAKAAGDGRSAAPGDGRKRVVAVIGDGAMTGGLAFEGLNNTSMTKNNLLIVLNDNNMAIDPIKGGFTQYLVDLTTSKRYNNWRWWIYRAARKLRLITDDNKGRVQRLTNNLKAILTKQGNNIFQGLNLRYFGPADGHDVLSLIRIFQEIKDYEGPKVLHIITKKGKGYEPAENDQTTWHAPGEFNVATGERRAAALQIAAEAAVDGRSATPVDGRTKAQEPLWQEVFGNQLLQLAKEDERIVGVTPAMPSGCSMNILQREMPERVFDVGIAEGHAVTFSAGMAKAGMKPYCNIYSSFLQRAYDNIIHDVALPKLPVVFCIDRAGIVGNDGATHHGLLDLAFLRPIPNMVIGAPMTKDDLEGMMLLAKDYDGPIAIRYPRGRTNEGDEAMRRLGDEAKVTIGKGVCLREAEDGRSAAPVDGRSASPVDGRRVAVLSIGAIGNTVSEAIELLGDKIAANAAVDGGSASPVDGRRQVAHYDMRWLKPMDEHLLHEIGKRFTTIITVEDGVISGGLGSAVLEFMADNGYTPRVIRLGVNDQFVEHGSTKELYHLLKLDKEGICESLLQALEQ